MGKLLMHPFVIVLQLYVQQVHLIFLFALILVGEEASGKYQEQRNDRKEQFPAERQEVRGITQLRSSIHILSGLRCIFHKSLFSYADG